MSGQRGWKTKETRRENLNRLLKLIKENQPVTYSDLKTQLAVSDPTLADYLKYLEERGYIDHSEGEDRRTKLYKIKPESESVVDSSLRKHTAIAFIDSIEDPIHTFLRGKDGKAGVSVFMSSAEEQGHRRFDNIIKKTLQRITDNMARKWLRFYEENPPIRDSFLGRKVEPGVKIALVLTYET